MAVSAASHIRPDEPTVGSRPAWPEHLPAGAVLTAEQLRYLIGDSLFRVFEDPACEPSAKAFMAALTALETALAERGDLSHVRHLLVDIQTEMNAARFVFTGEHHFRLGLELGARLQAAFWLGASSEGACDAGSIAAVSSRLAITADLEQDAYLATRDSLVDTRTAVLRAMSEQKNPSPPRRPVQAS
jgi:hypothetical protein